MWRAPGEKETIAPADQEPDDIGDRVPADRHRAERDRDRIDRRERDREERHQPVSIQGSEHGCYRRLSSDRQERPMASAVWRARAQIQRTSRFWPQKRPDSRPK